MSNILNQSTVVNQTLRTTTGGILEICPRHFKHIFILHDQMIETLHADTLKEYQDIFSFFDRLHILSGLYNHLYITYII